MIRNLFHNKRGLTFIEVFTSMFLSTLVFSGVYAFFTNVSQISGLKKDLEEIQKRGKIAMYILTKDASRGGEGIFQSKGKWDPLCYIPGAGSCEPDKILIVMRENDVPVTSLRGFSGQGTEEKQNLYSGILYVANVEPAGCFHAGDRLLVFTDKDWAVLTLSQAPIQLGECLMLRHDPDKVLQPPWGLTPVFWTSAKVAKLSTIEISHDAEKQEIFKKINNCPAKKLLGGIESLRFLYGMKDGTVTDSPSDFREIREVTIEVTVKSLHESWTKDPGKRLTFTQVISPRAIDG